MAIAAGALIGAALGGTAIGWTFAAVAGGALIGGALGYAVESMIPEIPEQPNVKQSPTYSSQIEQNQSRLGGAIPYLIGTTKFMPDLVAKPYSIGFQNTEYSYYLMSLTAGLPAGVLDSDFDFTIGLDNADSVEGLSFVVQKDFANNSLTQFAVTGNDVWDGVVATQVGGDPDTAGDIEVRSNQSEMYYHSPFDTDAPNGSNSAWPEYPMGTTYRIYALTNATYIQSVTNLVYTKINKIDTLRGVEIQRDVESSGIYGPYRTQEFSNSGVSAFYVNFALPNGLCYVGDDRYHRVEVYVDIRLKRGDADVDVRRYKQVLGSRKSGPFYDCIRESFNVLAGDYIEFKLIRVYYSSPDPARLDALYFGDVFATDPAPISNHCALLAARFEGNAEFSKLAEKKVYCKVSNPDTTTLRKAVESVWVLSGLNPDDLDASPLDECVVTECNGILDTQAGLFDTLKKIVAVGRAYPVRTFDGKVTFYVDKAKPISATLTSDMIVRDSLSYSQSFERENENDGFAVKWFDESIMKKVDAVYPANALKPKKVDVFGVTDETIATNHAQYLWERSQLLNKRYSFQTELDGLALTVGDRVAIDLPECNINTSVIISSIKPSNGTVSIDAVQYDESLYGV